MGVSGGRRRPALLACVLLVVVLLPVGCTSTPPPDPCAAATRDVNKLDKEIAAYGSKASTPTPLTEAEQQDKDLKTRLAMRIVVDNAKCYSPKDVAIAKEYLALPR